MGEHAYYLLSGELSFDEISALPDNRWIQSPDAIVHLEKPVSGAWVKLPVVTPEEEAFFLLEVDLPTLDTLIAFIPGTEGHYERIAMGESVHFGERPFHYQTFLVPFNTNGKRTTVLYFYVSSAEQINLPITIAQRIKQFENSVVRDLVFGLYAGVILTMFFYNLFVFITTRDRGYLYYITYIFFVGMVQVALAGYGFKFLWPELPEWQQISLNFLNTGTALFAYLFFASFVRLKKVLPKAKYAFWVLLGVYAVQLVLALAGESHVAYDLMNMSALLLSFLFIAVSVLAIKKGVREARFFFGAWMFFFLGVIVFVLKDVGVLPYNVFTANILQLGSGLEVVLLSFGLADRINILKREKEASQMEALQISLENQRIVSEQNVILEEKVTERTDELNQALSDVKNAQSQLVEQEKLASLGQLTAGIAHEINNPINFVTANINPLKRDVADVLEVLDAYLKFKTGEDFEKGKADVDELAEDLELDFLREEIEQLLNGIEDGAKRTAEIVRGLKIFSRTDEHDLKHVDLVEGIESTLTLLNSAMKGKVTVERFFESIPKVECYGGKVNQVFMNILSNAMQAIQEKPNGMGTIKIAVKDLDGKVAVSIADDANGIPPEKLNKIFDPFFTTKPVGEGTGLGLSIAKGIIEKHNGTITVESKVGEGTTFLIILPTGQSAL
jgi:signal transduction histidine kinase